MWPFNSPCAKKTCCWTGSSQNWRSCGVRCPQTRSRRRSLEETWTFGSRQRFSQVTTNHFNFISWLIFEGSGSSSHHVYQIFLRAGNDEWNIYRRYAQFYALHSDLKKLDPAVTAFDFPPKKSIGKKVCTIFFGELFSNGAISGFSFSWR